RNYDEKLQQCIHTFDRNPDWAPRRILYWRILWKERFSARITTDSHGHQGVEIRSRSDEVRTPSSIRRKQNLRGNSPDQVVGAELSINSFSGWRASHHMMRSRIPPSTTSARSLASCVGSNSAAAPKIPEIPENIRTICF